MTSMARAARAARAAADRMEEEAQMVRESRRVIVADPTSNLNERDEYGMTPLMVAAADGTQAAYKDGFKGGKKGHRLVFCLCL